MPTDRKRGADLRERISQPDGRDLAEAHQRAERELAVAQLLTYSDPDYPASVYESNNPVPVLWVRGPKSRLTQHAVARVGSRHIRACLRRESPQAAVLEGARHVSAESAHLELA